MEKNLTRAANFEAASIDEDARTVRLAFASEAPVERSFGREVLEISERAIRRERLANGAPLLVDHEWRDHVGVIESFEIGVDRIARALVRFGRSTRADEIFRDVIDGIRRSVSVGYQIHEIKEERDGDVRIARVTDWEPLEVSIVSVPADVSVGVGRAATPAPATPPAPKEQEVITVTDQQIEVDETAIRQDGAAAERHRVSEIIAIGEQFARFGGEKLAAEAVRNGTTVEAFQRAVMDNVTSAPVPSAEIGLTDQETRQFSIVRALNALANPTDQRAREAAAFEFEASRAAAEAQGKEVRGIMVPADVIQRDLTAGTASEGGDTVATNLLAGSFIDMLRNAMVLSGLGITTLTGLRGNIAIPRQSGGATAYWVAESGAPSASQQAFDQVTMSPETLGARTSISRRLLIQSSIDVENLVRRDLATVMGLELERAAINGSGSSNEPRGILNVSGIGAVAGGTDGAALAWSHVVDLETAIAAANADLGSLAYLTNTKVRGAAKQTEKFSSSNGAPIWADGSTPLNGYRAAVTNAIPSNLTKGGGSDLSAMIFGNFRDLIMGMWGGLELQVDPYSSGDTGTVVVRAFQDADVAVRHPESFAAMTDIVTS